jgi:hypothetical protein
VKADRESESSGRPAGRLAARYLNCSTGNNLQQAMEAIGLQMEQFFWLRFNFVRVIHK